MEMLRIEQCLIFDWCVQIVMHNYLRLNAGVIVSVQELGAKSITANNRSPVRIRQRLPSYAGVAEWQTRQTQNLMLNEHMGSSPISGTIISKTNRNKSCFLLSFLYPWQRSSLLEIK